MNSSRSLVAAGLGTVAFAAGSYYAYVVYKRRQRDAGLGKNSGTCSAANEKIYNQWGSDKYDQDVRSWGYDAPEKVTALLCEAMEQKRGRVLDAGVGTGLQGPSLSSAGFSPLMGLDISDDLLKQAGTTGCYETLSKADLNKPLELPDNSFDGLVCVGVLTYIDATNKPNLLSEFCRVVKPGGGVAFTSRTDKAGPWQEAADELVAAGKWRLVKKTEPMPYLPGNADYADKILVIAWAYIVQ